jgi:hypothetical protein
MSERRLRALPPLCCIQVLECWLWSLGRLGLRLVWGRSLEAGVDARAAAPVCRLRRVALRCLDVGFGGLDDLAVDSYGAWP